MIRMISLILSSGRDRIKLIQPVGDLGFGPLPRTGYLLTLTSGSSVDDLSGEKELICFYAMCLALYSQLYAFW